MLELYVLFLMFDVVAAGFYFSVDSGISTNM
jgi:hypothetical protein